MKIDSELELADYTDGDGVRSSNTQLSTKSEAQPISFAVGG